MDVKSDVPSIDPSPMRSKMRTSPGDVFNAEAVEKTTEDMTIELAKLGHPFAVVRPQVVRDQRGATINLVYRIEDGSRTYVEQINIRGNVKTQDHVIRREFDLGEGDAYNRALVARAERRLKNLNYFKTVKITTEPGSSPDRVILNVEVEEQNTGEFAIAGGYSTSDGFLGEVRVGERNLLGTGLDVKASVRLGDISKGVELAVTQPYIMGSQDFRRHQPVCQAVGVQQLSVVRQRDHRGDVDAGDSADRASRRPSPLFALSSAHHARPCLDRLHDDQSCSGMPRQRGSLGPSQAGGARRARLGVLYRLYAELQYARQRAKPDQWHPL